MKMIRTAALVAAAGAAYSKAKDYARENPAKASETIDKVESFVRGKAGPKHADKVGKGRQVLRSSRGLTGTTSSSSSDQGTVSRPATSTPSSTTPPAPADGSGATGPQGFDPAI